MAGERIVAPYFEGFDGVENNHQFFGPVKLANGMEFDITVGSAGAGPRPNEDAIAVHRTPDGILYLATFDGATSLRPAPLDLPEGYTGARFASRFLRNRLHEVVVESSDISPDELMLRLNDELRREVMGRGAKDTHKAFQLPSSTGTISRLGDTAMVDIAHVGDCIAWIQDMDGGSEIVTKDRNEPFDREVLDFMARLVFEEGMTPKQARNDPRTQTALELSRQYKDNRADGTGTGVINGDEHMASYVQRESRDLTDKEGMTKVTDGMLASLLNPDRVELRSMIDKQVDAEGSFAGVVDRTRQVERADPELRTLRLKESDDASGIRARRRLAA